MALALCGSWLACDSITSVLLTHRGVCIAGKPGSHRKNKKSLPAKKIISGSTSSCKRPSRPMSAI
ncbi:hypothetical protein BFW89_03635 [Pseudomonas synxantha]|nr:hypothetical protein BFW89_03635 [Pseudomonas synxantha]